MGIRVEVKPTAGWYVGERKQLAFSVKDAAGAPVDVGAWSLQWALMKKATAPDFLIAKDGEDGITTDDGPEGVHNVILVNITADDYALVRAGVELYQELTRTDLGQESVLASGPVTLAQSGIL